MDEAAKPLGLAGQLVLQGKPPAKVAAAVGSTRQTVYRWLDVLNDAGFVAPRVMSKGGRPAGLDPAAHEKPRRIQPAASSIRTDAFECHEPRQVSISFLPVNLPGVPKLDVVIAANTE